MLVPDLLAHSARRYPEKTCIWVEGRSLTFAETSDRAARLTTYLRTAGYTNERIALLAMNELEYTEIRVAAQRAGVMLVPLNYRMSADELTGIVRDCSPSLLIVGPGCTQLASALPASKRLDLEDHDESDGRYGDILTASEPEPIPAGLDADEAGLLCYTSGTTSRPKGVVLSNGALHAMTLQMAIEIGAHSQASYLAANPMFHIGHTVGFAFCYVGGTHVQLKRFDVTRCAELLGSGTITHTQLVPAMIRALLNQGGTQPAGCLERVLYGAAPMPPDLARQVATEWGCELVNGYGSTEAMGMTMLPPADHAPTRPHLLSSVGRSSPGMTVRIVDDQDRDVDIGVVGEVITRGTNLMSGYWRNPTATAEALRGGWMHTGDLAYRDQSGYLYLVDRRNDRIVTGGENVYPTEVENVLLSHPSVAETAVVGIPDDTWGERVSAAIVIRKGETRQADDLLRHCRNQLAGYKVPKQVRFVQSLPRTATGKIMRRELRSNWPTSLEPTHEII